MCTHVCTCTCVLATFLLFHGLGDQPSAAHRAQRESTESVSTMTFFFGGGKDTHSLNDFLLYSSLYAIFSFLISNPEMSLLSLLMFFFQLYLYAWCFPSSSFNSLFKFYLTVYIPQQNSSGNTKILFFKSMISKNTGKKQHAFQIHYMIKHFTYHRWKANYPKSPFTFTPKQLVID